MHNSEKIKEYENHLILERKVASSTLRSYMRDVKMFLLYLKDTKNITFLDANEEILKDYIKLLKISGKSIATVARAVYSLKSFYGYFASVSELDDDPAKNLVVGRVINKSSEVLTLGEVEHLLAQPLRTTLKGYRDAAMLELLYATGIKVSEIVAIEVEDIDISNACLICHSGEKYRTLKLHPRVVLVLKDYVSYIRPQLVSDVSEKALFLNMKGKRMSREGFWKLVKGYQHSARINKNITPHTFRRSLAVHLIARGTDLQSLQELLGHADISTTYTYLSFARRYEEDLGPQKNSLFNDRRW